MKIYLINLDKDIERLQSVDCQCRRLGITYERISAVNGRMMSEKDRHKAVNAFRWWCSQGRPIRIGEIGCAKSHYSIYSTLTETACIMEDDVIINDSFKEVLERVEQWIDPSRPQVVLLSNHTKKQCSKSGIFPAKADVCTEGYVITPVAAAALLKANFPIQRPCDHWRVWARRKVIELYHAFPTVCSQNKLEFDSRTVDPGCFRVADLSIFPKMVHKSKRVIGKFLDFVLPL